MRSRGSWARCEAPRRQLERPGEPARGRRGDPPARDLRAAGAGWRRQPPRDRPGDERLAGVRARGGARRDAGAPRRRASQLRAAGAGRGPCPAGRAPLRRGRRGHQQAAPLPADADTVPLYAIVPHLFGTTAFVEATWPVATLVWLSEIPIPPVYGRAAFHAISESTRDDLVCRGVARDRIEVIYPGVDAAWYCPDGATLRAAWAVVFPSPKEGWGISNVEAAACGTPALASDSPGLRESVRHGETGFLVPH